MQSIDRMVDSLLIRIEKILVFNLSHFHLESVVLPKIDSIANQYGNTRKEWQV